VENDPFSLRSLRHRPRSGGVWQGIARGVGISSQSGHRLPALTVEQNKALALTPADELLQLPFLERDPLKDSLHANQLEAGKLAPRHGGSGALGEAWWSHRYDHPGIVMTPLAKDELTGPRGEGYRRMIESSVAKRAGTPDEVGAVGALLMGQTVALSPAPIS
jgi:hypothetical protein